MILKNAVAEYLNYLEGLNYSRLTIKSYKQTLESFVLFMETKYNRPVFIEDLDRQELERFLIDHSKRKVEINTFNRRLYTFRGFFDYISNKKEYCSKNLALSIKPMKTPAREKACLTEAEIEMLASEIYNHGIRLMVRLMACTGLRVSECIALRVKDIVLDTEESFIVVKQGKGSKDRIIPLNLPLAAELQAYSGRLKGVKQDDYFFTGRNSKKISPYSINYAMKEAAGRLGWNKKISAHVLRHSFASSMVKHGVNIVTVQKMLGHASIQTTSVYCHTDFEAMAEAVEKLQV